MQKPSLTVVIPCYNENAKNLIACIDSIFIQLKGSLKSTEVLLCLNGSNAETRHTAMILESRFARLTVLEMSKPNKNAAMNLSRRMSNTKFILYCDADTIHIKGSVKLALKEAFRTDAAIVGAGRKPIPSKTNSYWYYYYLRATKRLSRSNLVSVQGWFMLVNSHKIIEPFPEDGTPDDVWLSAYTWMHYGASGIGYVKRTLGIYEIPASEKSSIKQLARHHVNYRSVEELHPELAPYFQAKKQAHLSVSLNEWQKTSGMSKREFLKALQIHDSVLSIVKRYEARNSIENDAYKSWIKAK